MRSSSIDRSSELRHRFLKRAGLGDQPSLWEWVEAVREIPYGRTSARSVEAVVEEWRGTCSTKHALLAMLLEGRPEFGLEIVHRVYRIDRAMAGELYGEDAASAVPDEGLVDVHTYAVATVGGERVQLDVTFPGTPWDGRSDMPLACGEGEDHAVGSGDLFAVKDALVAEHCDPAVREPFIAALSR